MGPRARPRPWQFAVQAQLEALVLHGRQDWMTSRTPTLEMQRAGLLSGLTGLRTDCQNQRWVHPAGEREGDRMGPGDAGRGQVVVGC